MARPSGLWWLCAAMIAVILAGVLRAAAQTAPHGQAASEAWTQDVCTATGECVACTAEPSQSGGPSYAADLDACAETGYAMGYLCTSSDDSTTSSVVYRSCPMPPGIARNHFIIFELVMAITLAGSCMLTLRRQRMHDSERQSQLAARFGSFWRR